MQGREGLKYICSRRPSKIKVQYLRMKYASSGFSHLNDLGSFI